MKHYLADRNIRTFCAVGMRHATTTAGIPHVCTIRKCARDRACTGPLVACRPPGFSIRFAAYQTLESDEDLIPVCIAVSSDEELVEIIAIYQRLIDAYKENPAMPLMEPRRTIEARKWTKIGEIPA
jgi:hypothetical protein